MAAVGIRMAAAAAARTLPGEFPWKEVSVDLDVLMGCFKRFPTEVNPNAATSEAVAMAQYIAYGTIPGNNIFGLLAQKRQTCVRPGCEIDEAVYCCYSTPILVDHFRDATAQFGGIFLGRFIGGAHASGTEMAGGGHGIPHDDHAIDHHGLDDGEHGGLLAP